MLMQRSLSSPVAIHSSPPLSPTVPRTSPSPSPSSPEKHVIAGRRRRFTSRSPLRSPEVAMSAPLRQREEPSASRPTGTTPAGNGGNSPTTSRKPIVAQVISTATTTTMVTPAPKDSVESFETMPSPPAGPLDLSLAQPKAQALNMPMPLLTDVSLYTNPQLSLENDSTTLEELAHLVRLARYQERKRGNTRIRLQRNLISTALSARLMRCGDLAHRNLVDCFRGDDKKTFASLYNAVIDVRRSCDETRKFALLDPEMEGLQSPGVASVESLDTPTTSSTIGANLALGSVAPFLNDISASARETFLGFLSQIRTNPDYLATRLCSLNSAELSVLTNFHQGLDTIESVLPYHSHNRPSGRGSGNHASNRNSAVYERNAIERLLSFQRHDPLSALIHTCFANSAGPDSAEDKRRTATWATACARLISEKKSGTDQILTAIFNAWAAMRDWSGRSSMEWYLMKILEDGAFLLDRAEDQHGTRFNIADWTQKDQIAAEEFYDRAVNELFEIVDDEDATGIPEGLIELGNEVLKRLDPKHVDSTRRWFVYKWLFSVWLLGVVIHPESYGMMAEYHISEYGRQRILKGVAMKAQQLVVDMTWPHTKQPVSTPPRIKTHIENILGRFQNTKSRRNRPRLLPARSITSLRETAEVHPYLVISPADLATLVNALFPERRPQSAHSSSLRSGAPSISGFSAISQPASLRTMQSSFDTASVVSAGAESFTSDVNVSREQSMGSPRRYSPPVQDQASQKRMSNYDDDGYRLRLAMHEMVQVLGPDVVYGSCHPCRERWAVLFISSDGNSLSTQMTYDPDDEPEEEENSSTSDTDEDSGEDSRPELDKDYHLLRDSILKLVEEFEIPHLETEGSSKFSNRATGLKKYRSKNKIITAAKTMSSRNPYRQRAPSVTSVQTDTRGSPESSKGKENALDTGDHAETSSQADSEPTPVLVAMLNAASSQSRAQSDFVSAHLYWRTLQQLNAVSSDSLRRNGFAALLNIFSRGPRDSIRRSASAIEEYDAWLVWLKQSQERAEGLTENMMRRMRAIRDKMWYVTDVRNSAPFEHSRNIALALKTMGMPRRWNSFQRNKHHISTNYLLRTESQIIDLLAASEDQGGPNKLSDDQAERTGRYLQQFGIENFCRGEERIHRFCYEIDNCINKLVGESIVDSPVLWSSELFLRDRRALESFRQLRDRDSQVWDDSASIMSDPDRRYPSGGSRLFSMGRDLRHMSGLNMSQQSIDSGRFSFSRASTAMSDVLEGSDYFGVSSPVHTIDSSTTFWSPFQSAISPSSATSRAHSPTTSLSNLSMPFANTGSHHQSMHSQSQHPGARPGTSTSSNETVFQQRLSDEKARFLAELRQTLTSLLLSELGNLVFARGSETDGWFEGLGQECIERRQAVQRYARHSARSSTGGKESSRAAKNLQKPRVIEKKKSFGDLRNAGSAETIARDVSSPKSSPQTADQPGTAISPGNTDNHVAGEKATIRSQPSPTKKDSTPEFPFVKAYQRLLRMFCVHPNPYAKLNALFELEHLIVASLTSGSRRSRLAWAHRSDLGSTSSATDDHSGNTVQPAGRAAPLEEAIDNVKERRSHILSHNAASSPATGAGGRGDAPNPDTRSVVSVNPANTDAIANVLQSLFRDAGLRPKTLFRDLQYIASFVPSSILDRTDRGKAFWDAGLAALSLKQEVCRTMVEVADGIVKLQTEQTKKGTIPDPPEVDLGSLDQSDTSAVAVPPPLPLSTYSLADAARMWTITAREGDPTSQRELALFYLSNPELVERTTMPLSKPREVFKQTVMEKYGASRGADRYHHHHAGSGLGSSGRGLGSSSGLGGGAGSGLSGPGLDKDGGVRDVRTDPALMCVAIHWMEAAETGGDELARQFLGQHEIVGL